MQKYLLNIEKLYSGDTANALVLNQVDEELPTLIPSIDDRMKGIPAFIHKWHRLYSEFNPPNSQDIDELNSYIIEFNLKLQDDFKKRGHQELYMMDDTYKEIKPNDANKSIHSQKLHMHNLNGIGKVGTVEDDNGNKQDVVGNVSQLNVLFPFKKASAKSLYSNVLKVKTPQ